MMKKLLYTLLGLIVALAIASQLFIDQALTAALQRSGFGNVTFEKARLGFEGLRMENVTIPAGDAEIRAKALALTPGKVIIIENLAATAGDMSLSGVNATLHMDSLVPAVFTHQAITADLLSAGLPLTNGKMDISMDAARKVTVHKSEWILTGGSVGTSPFSLVPGNMTADLTLIARDLDLEKLFSLIETEGLDATGRVSGSIPLKIRDGSVSIVNGALETHGGGKIRYNPKDPPAFLKDASSSQILDLRVALTAFDYDSLKMTMDGEARKDQKISIEAHGRNPGFYNGHDVVIHFNVEGPLQSVIENTPRLHE
jgi:hypothetical protein